VHYNVYRLRGYLQARSRKASGERQIQSVYTLTRSGANPTFIYIYIYTACSPPPQVHYHVYRLRGYLQARSRKAGGERQIQSVFYKKQMHMFT